MLGNLNGWHLLILLAVILLLFGAAKLPALAKSVGQSARVFKGEMKAMKDEEDKTTTVDAVTSTTTSAEPSASTSSTAPADATEHKP